MINMFTLLLEKDSLLNYDAIGSPFLSQIYPGSHTVGNQCY